MDTADSAWSLPEVVSWEGSSVVVLLSNVQRVCSWAAVALVALAAVNTFSKFVVPAVWRRRGVQCWPHRCRAAPRRGATLVTRIDARAANTADAVWDIVLRGGSVFDGTGAPPVVGDVAVRDGAVWIAGEAVLGRGAREVDAAGLWVTPGLLDIHTHYDAEVEGCPGLEESVRHGVTTVVFGNCSLSVAAATSRDTAVDLFARVENMPRDVMRSMLGPAERLPWEGDVAAYYEHLEGLPLGPNVATFLGHSDVRARVMGLARAVSSASPRAEEREEMQRLLRDAMAAGYLGLSIDLLAFHRLSGPGELVGQGIPSQHASWGEIRSLASVVKRAGGVVQATPNALRPLTAAALFLTSVWSAFASTPLKLTILAALDVKHNGYLGRLATAAARFVNGALGGDVKFQSLPAPFLVFSDGVLSPLMEEFPSGARAMDTDEAGRMKLFGDAEFRRRFAQEWRARGPRLFARDLDDMWVVRWPVEADAVSYAGRSMTEVARSEGYADALECFMDSIKNHGDKLRWRTVVANHRDEERRRLLAHRDTLPGFTDSGAHSRNMSFHDGGLRVLRDAVRHPEWMSPQRAVHRVTHECADWLGVDAGLLRCGSRADILVVDPVALAKDGALGDPQLVKDERIHGAERMLRRAADDVVRLVVIGGRVAWNEGHFAPQLGKERFGRLLRRI